MHVVVVNPSYDPGIPSPGELLRRYRTLPECAEAAAAAARDEGRSDSAVVVVQRFDRDAAVDSGGVRYRFVADRGRPALRWWQSSRAVVAAAAEASRAARREGLPAVVHLHGLVHAAVVPDLRRALPAGVPVVLQHHAERPRAGVGGWHQRRALSGADGFLFAARGLADPWISRRTIKPEAPIFEVMEGSTTFTGIDPVEARRRTGIDGSPTILWVGRLDDNKDPLTVLAGLEQVLPEIPTARVFVAYGADSTLVAAVERRIAASETLGRAVRLLGTVPRDDMEALFSSADYFVLGSRYEGSGFALAEALACGVVPIVTDIPSFRMMTGDGSVGALWTAGDPAACAAAVRSALARPLAEQSRAARELFVRRLGYAAIGRASVAAYAAVLASVNDRRREPGRSGRDRARRDETG